MWWLQSETGYTFNGEAPVSGLTRHELDFLMLGHLVAKEQEDAAQSGDTRSVHKQKQKLRQRHRSRREEVFGDLGIQ